MIHITLFIPDEEREGGQVVLARSVNPRDRTAYPGQQYQPIAPGSGRDFEMPALQAVILLLEAAYPEVADQFRQVVAARRRCRHAHPVRGSPGAGITERDVLAGKLFELGFATKKLATEYRNIIERMLAAGVDVKWLKADVRETFRQIVEVVGDGGGDETVM